MAPREQPLPRLSAKEALILELLSRGAEMYGLELVAASQGALKRGTVYVTLGRMEAKGFISSRCEDTPPAVGGLPRRLYRPTATGRHLLAALTAPAQTPGAEVRAMTRPGTRSELTPLALLTPWAPNVLGLLGAAVLLHSGAR